MAILRATLLAVQCARFNASLFSSLPKNWKSQVASRLKKCRPQSQYDAQRCFPLRLQQPTPPPGRPPSSFLRREKGMDARKEGSYYRFR